MDNSDEDDLLQSQDQKRSAKWWETAEDHRFALEVLQLRARREILKLISFEARSLDEIEKAFSLTSAQSEHHLAMLEKALVIERSGEIYRLTETGRLYLERVENRR